MHPAGMGFVAQLAAARRQHVMLAPTRTALTAGEELSGEGMPAPVLVTTVDIGDDRVEQIELREGDSPEVCCPTAPRFFRHPQLVLSHQHA